MILFLDTSAFIKLFLQERASAELTAFVGRSPNESAAIASITQIESRSVLERKLRNRELDLASHQAALQAVTTAAGTWLGVRLDQGVVEYSLQIVERHALRSLDAIQLGSALALKEAFAQEESLLFIASDQRLLAAAQADGLPSWNPESGPPPVSS